MNKYLRLIGFVILCQSAGLLGSLFTFSAVSTWYPTLIKPFFTPPSWLFGPAWTTLYLLMGLSLYLVWKPKRNLNWFWVQLVLNALWSIIFFGLQQPTLALLEILALWYAILMTIRTFRRYSQTAANLLVPYILWVSFATILNAAIVYLNY